MDDLGVRIARLSDEIAGQADRLIMVLRQHNGGTVDFSQPTRPAVIGTDPANGRDAETREGKPRISFSSKDVGSRRVPLAATGGMEGSRQVARAFLFGDVCREICDSFVQPR